MLTVVLIVGHGHSAQYLDRTRVTKYVALEPNAAMHPEIRKIDNSRMNPGTHTGLLTFSFQSEVFASFLLILVLLFHSLFSLIPPRF